MANKVLITGPFHTLTPDVTVTRLDGSIVKFSDYTPDANKVVTAPDLPTAQALAVGWGVDPNTLQLVRFSRRIKAYSAMVMEDGPAAYYRLGEAAGNYADLTGANPLTVIGAGLVRGTASLLAGDADLSLTGAVLATSLASTAAAVPALAFPGNAPFSVEFWASTTLTTSGAGYIVSHRSGSGNLDGWAVTMDIDGNMQFLRSDASVAENTFIASPAAVHDGFAHHYVQTYTGSAMAMWMDGVRLINTLNRTKVIGTASAAFTVGNTPVGTAGNAWPGILDDLAIYPYVLSESQIRAHYITGLVGP